MTFDRGATRSHALRGDALSDALRPRYRTLGTQSVLRGVPTQSVGTSQRTALLCKRFAHFPERTAHPGLDRSERHARRCGNVLVGQVAVLSEQKDFLLGGLQ